MLVEIESNWRVVARPARGFGGAAAGFTLFVDAAIAIDGAGTGLFASLCALAGFALLAGATGSVVTALRLGDAFVRVAHKPSFAVAVSCAFSAFALYADFIVFFAVIV